MFSIGRIVILYGTYNLHFPQILTALFWIIQRLNTTLVRITPCFTAVIQIRQNECTVWTVNGLTLYITETWFAILFVMPLRCLLQFNWKSKCTPRNFVTTTLVSIPFILILQLSSHFLLIHIIKLVLEIFKESLFAWNQRSAQFI